MMAKQINIPEAWRMLVNCLQCAVHDLPPGQWIANADWSTLLRQARGHSVETYLFPWLCKNLPEQFSAHAFIPDNSPQAVWRSLALKHLGATIQRQIQAKEILSAFVNAGVDIIPLKGIWLSETVYNEASQRKMVDIDLLVERTDTNRAIKLLNGLGYAAHREMSNSEYMCDLSFYHPDRKIFIELHWNVECKMSGENEIPDIEKILQRTTAANLLEYPVKILSAEDQLCHLAQHILHHQFGLSLKSYIDIALFYRAKANAIEISKLSNVARDWKTGMTVPFILQLVSTIFDIDMPDELIKHNTGQDTLQKAVTTIFELPETSAMLQEINLLKYRKASITGRIRLILERIFMPQSFMQLHYPFARRKLLLPAAWFLRALTLLKTSGHDVLATKESTPNLKNAADRAEIIRELSKEKF